jgi:dienelactone hydrolase
MKCYWTGASIDSKPKRIVIIFSDVFGMETGNHKAFADSIAERLGPKETAVIMPDLFRGNPILQPWLPSFLSEYGGSVLGAPSMLLRIKFKHPPESIELDLIELIFPWLRDNLDLTQISFSCIGFCFGGWVVGRVLSLPDLPFKAGVGIHPSFQPELLHLGTPEGMAERIGTKPCLLLPAYNDDLKTNSKVVLIMAEARGVSVDEVSIEFPTMRHGWVTRGDSANVEIAEQQELALKLSAEFLKKHS